MKKTFYILLVLLGISFFSVIILSLSKKSAHLAIPLLQSPTPTPVTPPSVLLQAINYQEVFADKSVAKQMGEKFSKPLTTETQDEYIVGHFASDAATLATDVYLQKGVAKFVVQTMSTENKYFGDFSALHSGIQQETFYDPLFSGSGFVWKVYPTEGVAFFTNPDDGFAGKVLYFAPTTSQSFLDTTAKTLHFSTKQPPELDATNGILERADE